MQLGPKVVFTLAGMPFTDTFLTGVIISILIFIAGVLIGRSAKMIPGRWQMVVEMFISSFVDLIDGLMPNQGRKYFPMVGTILLFIGVSNLASTIPFVVSPTADINTTAAYALVVFIVSHYVGMCSKGVWPYIKGYFQPIFFMAPLNIIGELARPISHAFRLFGNMLAGGIILAIAMQFVPWLLPVPLMGWFNLFQGLIQAFIFGMLAIVYISVQKG